MPRQAMELSLTSAEHDFVISERIPPNVNIAFNTWNCTHRKYPVWEFFLRWFMSGYVHVSNSLVTLPKLVSPRLVERAEPSPTLCSITECLYGQFWELFFSTDHTYENSWQSLDLAQVHLNTPQIYKYTLFFIQKNISWWILAVSGKSPALCFFFIGLWLLKFI